MKRRIPLWVSHTATVIGFILGFGLLALVLVLAMLTLRYLALMLAFTALLIVRG